MVTVPDYQVDRAIRPITKEHLGFFYRQFHLGINDVYFNTPSMVCLRLCHVDLEHTDAC